MKRWVLIIAIVNMLGDSGIALTSVGPFATWEDCDAAAQRAESLEGIRTDVRTTCVEVLP